jgi:hypothetical protein
MAIRIPFIAEVAAALRGTKDLSDGLEKVVDSLDDVDTASADAVSQVDRLGDSATDIGKLERATDDAADSSDAMERKFRDAFDTIKKESKAAGDTVSDRMDEGSRKATDATGEFKDEARQNFGEVAASFSGDMDSAADLVQGTFGGLAGTLTGPLGLAFGGLAAAAGLFFSAWSENAEKTKQTISDMYDDMLASGADFLSKDYIADQLSKIYQGADDAIIKVSELRDLANTANIPEPLLARALVGDEQARAEVTTAISEQRLRLNEALDDATAKGSNVAPVLAPALEALRDIEDAVADTSTELNTAQQNATAARDAISSITAPTQGVATSAEDARAKFDGLGREIADLPAVKTVTVQVDGRALDDFLSKPRRVLVGVAAERNGMAVV